VRNSGAKAVVEGTGDHGCEYMTGGVVVVLGPTGRNFGAGMSGGTAFVLDEENAFTARCNMGMVGVEPIDAADDEVLRALVEEHVARTGSVKGSALLARWADACLQFKKVIPTEYKRVLEQQRLAANGEIEGGSPIAAGPPPTVRPGSNELRHLKVVRGPRSGAGEGRRRS